ncbi:NAD(P)/FAD-dependent oxidoreductase [Parasphingorhabdus pacifica]
MSPRVVIIGAGYAGVSVAKRLARSTPQVTIVNPRADFVERIRLHQLLAGNHPATVPLPSLLPRSTTLVRDSATRIDAEDHVVTLAGGESLEFDHLVYAVGSRTGLDRIPGAREHAVTVGDLESTATARERFRRLPDGAPITIIGGGPSGVEVASELAELGNRSVRLVTDEPIARGVSDKGRRYIRRRLTALGVGLIENTAVTEIRADKVLLEDGRTLASDLSVATTTFEVPALARDSGLNVDVDGALELHPSLISTSVPAIVGAGDASRIRTHSLRMSCQAAIPLGTHAAETVLHLINRTVPAPVRPKFVSQCISLGRRSALWQRTDFADRPTTATVTGRSGALLKELICSGTTRFVLNPRFGRLTYGWS